MILNYINGGSFPQNMGDIFHCGGNKVNGEVQLKAPSCYRDIPRLKAIKYTMRIIRRRGITVNS